MNRHSPVFSSQFVKHLVRVFALMVVLSAIPALATAQTVKMHGTVPPGASTMTSRGHLDPAKILTLDLRFALRNRTQLTQLIAAQMDRASPQYHRWIAPDEFTRRFGATTSDFSALNDWLTASGFQVVGGSREEGYLRFSGDTASAERVFRIELEDFGNGKFANLTEPEIPAQFAGVVSDILGLHNLGSLEPDYATRKLKQSPAMPPRSTLSGHPAASGVDYSLGNGSFAFGPPDFYTFYDETPLLMGGNTGANGSDCIGIFANTNIYSEPSQATILKDYFALFLPFTSFSTDPAITIDLSKETNPGVIGNGTDIEAYLDIEAAHLIAPGAPITLYVTNPAKLSFAQNLTDAVTAMTSENKCAALNFSYHICGASNSFFTTTLGDLFSKAQTQGQSVFVSSGDHGVDMCLTGTPNVNELGANPLITSVGGTEVDSPSFDGSGISSGYSTESSWNQQNGNSALANESKVSGGGASAFFTKPSWQQGVAGTSDDNARDLPDVASLGGSPHIIVYADTDNGTTASPDRSTYLIVGTSLAAPLWTGYSRLLQTANGGKRLGSLNPTIWELGVAGQSASGFHDITAGNNTYISEVSGKDVIVPGYSAGPGYDLVTGWGSIDANAFVTAYLAAPSPSPIGTPTAAPTPSPLKASPTSLKFATTTVGVASSVKKVSLMNGGKKGDASITLNAISLSSNLANAAGTSCIAGVTLALKGKCTMALTMKPSAVGSNTGSVVIMSTAGNGSLTINTSVTGKVPKVKK
jgi:subtilase family serine protease